VSQAKLWVKKDPTRENVFWPTDEMKKKAWVSDEAIYKKAAADPVAFWSKQAEELHWFKKWDKAYDPTPYAYKWFVGGKINLSYNSLDRHIEAGHGEDGIEGFDGGGALDVDDQQPVLRAGGEVGAEFATGRFAVEQALKAAALDGSQLHRTAQGAHLFGALHVGRDHPRRAAVEDHRGGERIGRRNPNERRQAGELQFHAVGERVAQLDAAVGRDADDVAAVGFVQQLAPRTFSGRPTAPGTTRI